MSPRTPATPVPRRASTRLVAVLLPLFALLGAPLIVGTAAFAADPPTITSPASGGTVERGEPLIFGGGSAVAGSQLEVFLDEQVVCDFTVLTSGDWSCESTTPAEIGQHSVFARQTVPADGVNDGAIIEFSVVVPRPTTDQDSYQASPGAEFAVSGGGLANEGVISITVQHDEGTQTVCDAAEVGDDGRWTCSINEPLPLGDYSMSIVQSVEGVPSDPLDVPLRITTGEGGGEGGLEPLVDCAFTPGMLTMTTPETGEVSAGIWTVNPPRGDDTDYQPQSYGRCGGNTGTPFAGPFDDTTEVKHCELGPGQPACQVTGLTPGIWNLYFGFAESTSYDYFFTIPTAPTGMTVARFARPLEFTGSASPGNSVTVVDTTGAPVCVATASTDGSWGCAAAVDPTAEYRSYQTDAGSGGVSDLSAPAASAPMPPPATAQTAVQVAAPAAQKTPLAWTWRVRPNRPWLMRPSRPL